MGPAVKAEQPIYPFRKTFNPKCMVFFGLRRQHSVLLWLSWPRNEQKQHQYKIHPSGERITAFFPSEYERMTNDTYLYLPSIKTHPTATTTNINIASEHGRSCEDIYVSCVFVLIVT